MLFLGLLLIHPQHALSIIALIIAISMWGRFFKKDDTIKLEIRDLSTIEEKYFPEQVEIIKDLRDEFQQKKLKLDVIEQEIKAFQNHDTKLEKDISKEIKTLHNKIDNYSKALINFEELYKKKIEGVRLMLAENENDLKDGFDLGLWYHNMNQKRFEALATLQQHSVNLKEVNKKYKNTDEITTEISNNI